MWKIGNTWKLERADYREIKERIKKGEHPAEVAKDFYISEFDVKKISGTLEA